MDDSTLEVSKHRTDKQKVEIWQGRTKRAVDRALIMWDDRDSMVARLTEALLAIKDLREAAQTARDKLERGSGRDLIIARGRLGMAIDLTKKFQQD